MLQRSADTVSIKTDWLGAERTVCMDGRAHPPVQQRFPQGHSTGRFEGDVLVVDTTNFTDQEAQGVPAGAGKHLVERFTLADGGKSLSDEFVWRDPQFLADALTGTAELSFRPDLAPAGYRLRPRERGVFLPRIPVSNVRAFSAQALATRLPETPECSKIRRAFRIAGQQ